MGEQYSSFQADTACFVKSHLFFKNRSPETMHHVSAFATALLCIMYINVSESAKFMGEGCPDGKSPGDTWPLDGATCGECTCLDTRFGERTICSNCGVLPPNVFNLDLTKCHEGRDLSKPYPGCCRPIALCPGDEGFDATKLLPPRA